MVEYMHCKDGKSVQVADVPKEFDDLFGRLSDDLKLVICEYLANNDLILVIRNLNR